MSNKFTKKNATTLLQNATTLLQLDHIGLYNQQVSEFLHTNPLSALQQQAIKLFRDRAQINKLSDIQYNKEVEIFNKNGMILKKRAIATSHPDIDKYYNYINYPFLDREAIKLTMDKYRQYVYAYNTSIDKYNKEVTKYNHSLVEPKNKQQSVLINQTIADSSHLFTKDYNKLVESYNLSNGGVFIKKKKVQKIKFSTELLFHVLVGFYASQLKIRNANLMNSNLSTSCLKNSLPKLSLNQRRVSDHKIKDIPRLDMCKRTVQNHVKRLREAGILINYTYVNQNQPIQVNFNNKILAVLDGNLPKQQTQINKGFSKYYEKDLPDNNDTTRTFLKEKEIKGNVSKTIADLNTGSILKSLKTIRPADSYKNTIDANKSKNQSDPSKSLNKIERFSENLRKKIADDRDLAKDLSLNTFLDYKGIRYSVLERAVRYSNLSCEEFKELLIQDFIKSSSKIWKNHNVYEGEWKKAINAIKESFFKNLVHKSSMIDKLKEYRWKIDFARRWFLKNNDFNALFPSDYFDISRKQSYEMGFFGLHSVWKSHLKYNEKKELEKKRKILAAAERKRLNTEKKKLDNAISKFYQGKYDFENLYNYVRNNLPYKYLENLHMYIKTNTNNLA